MHEVECVDCLDLMFQNVVHLMIFPANRNLRRSDMYVDATEIHTCRYVIWPKFGEQSSKHLKGGSHVDCVLWIMSGHRHPMSGPTKGERLQNFMKKWMRFWILTIFCQRCRACVIDQ